MRGGYFGVGGGKWGDYFIWGGWERELELGMGSNGFGIMRGLIELRWSMFVMNNRK